jgi:hypothetical protein
VDISPQISILANDVLHTNIRVNITPQISILANDVLHTNFRVDITPQISILANDVLHTKFPSGYNPAHFKDIMQLLSCHFDPRMCISFCSNLY